MKRQKKILEREIFCLNGAIYFLKKKLRNIFGKDNYDWNWSGCSGVFSMFILVEEKKLERIVSKWNCEAFRKIKCLKE